MNRSKQNAAHQKNLRRMTANVIVLAFVHASLYLASTTITPPEPTHDYGECEVETGPDYAAACDLTPPAGLSRMVEAAATEYGVDPKLVATTVYRESDCDQHATGSSGEIGLGQVHPKVWLETLKEAGIARAAHELYDPMTNLRATAYILHILEGRADSREELFRLYNGSGPQAKKYGREQVAAYRSIWGKKP